MYCSVYKDQTAFILKTTNEIVNAFNYEYKYMTVNSSNITAIFGQADKTAKTYAFFSENSIWS